MVEVTKCRGTKADGAPCGIRKDLNASNGLCLFHDPERKAELTAWHDKGRANRGAKKPKRIESIEDVIAARDWLFGELMAKKIEKDEVSTMRALLADQEKSITQDLLGRVRALQRELKQLRRGTS